MLGSHETVSKRQERKKKIQYLNHCRPCSSQNAVPILHTRQPLPRTTRASSHTQKMLRHESHRRDNLHGNQRQGKGQPYAPCPPRSTLRYTVFYVHETQTHQQPCLPGATPKPKKSQKNKNTVGGGGQTQNNQYTRTTAHVQRQTQTNTQRTGQH